MLLSFRRPVMNVSDMERSLAFYRDILGMTVVYDNRMTDPDKVEVREAVGKAFSVSDVDMRWVVLEVPGEGAGREIELIQWNNPKPRPLPRSQNCYDNGVSWPAFNVQGIRAMYDKLASQGIKFRGPLAFPKRDRGLCYAIDPDGYTVELGGPL